MRYLTQTQDNVNEIIFGQIKNVRSSATWWRYKIGKTVTSKTGGPINLKFGYRYLCRRGTKGFKDICISQKTWPPLAKTIVTPIRQG